jgi:hypothetical protein
MNKTILLIVLTLLTTVTILQQPDNVHATPYLTNFGNGYTDGKHAGQHTFRSGGYRDASCPTYRIAQHITLATTRHGPNFQQEIVDDE